jgi:GDPmannose 4,6-dehydratase
LTRIRIDKISGWENSEAQNNFFLHYNDLNDFPAIFNIINRVNPDVIINLAAQSHVGISFEIPMETMNVIANGTLSILEAVRQINSEILVYHASTSEMFGGLFERKVLNEDSEFRPASPYAASKLLAHNMTKIYREAYGLNCFNGILFNHESPRRGENFVSRKITLAAANIYFGFQKKLKLGNIEAMRDWGHAKDFCEAIRLISEKNVYKSDYIVATGEMHSVYDFAKKSFSQLNLDIDKYLEIDNKLVRPLEVDSLKGDPRKIQDELGWKQTYSFDELISEMVDTDYKLIEKQIR